MTSMCVTSQVKFPNLLASKSKSLNREHYWRVLFKIIRMLLPISNFWSVKMEVMKILPPKIHLLGQPLISESHHRLHLIHHMLKYRGLYQPHARLFWKQSSHLLSSQKKAIVLQKPDPIYSVSVLSNKHSDVADDDSEDGNSSSSDDQTCNVSDFHISDMSIVGFPFDENMGLDDISAANPCPEYQYMDTDMMFDMAQRYMILPSLEDDMETSNIHDVESIEDAPITSDDSYFCLAIQHMKPSDQNDDFNCNSSELDEVDGFDPHLFIRNLPELSEVSPTLWPILQPKEIQKRSQVTLVLDLDETLVHSTLEYCDDADFTFSVYFNMKEHIIYVRQRPHLQMFLKRVAQMFEIIVFTASQSIYAEKLLNILDPDSKLISRRFYRESCIFSNGNYVKDLTILGLDLAKVAIIDNSPQVFQLQVNNGIPIESWFDDPSDHALISLLPFLETLVDVDDVRPIIAQRFNND